MEIPLKPYAEKFYKGPQWKKCREAYLRKVGWLCERCLKEGHITPAVIVHHKVYIDENRINDQRITLNFDNLEALCADHHNQEHKKKAPSRYTVDEMGRVQIKI